MLNPTAIELVTNFARLLLVVVAAWALLKTLKDLSKS